MLTRQAPLRVVQTQVGACGQGQRRQARQCGGIACAGLGQQRFGLFLEMAQVGPGGKTFHEYLRASNADGLQFRQHKGEVMNKLKELVGKWVTPCPQARARLASAQGGILPAPPSKMLVQKITNAPQCGEAPYFAAPAAFLVPICSLLHSPTLVATKPRSPP